MQVLITRPKTQAKSLAAALQQYDIDSVCFPAIEIVMPSTLVPLRQVLRNLERFAMLIFTSPNAVNQFLEYAATVKLTAQVFAIGSSTANLLEKNHISVAAYPQPANSEALLALLKTQSLIGKEIAIFTGEAGSTLLVDNLASCGAIVSMAYTHRRIMPIYSLPFSWKISDIDTSLCTSLTGLRNFRAMIDGYQLSALLLKPLLVITMAMQTVARQLNFKSAIILAEGASDNEIITALQNYDLNEKQNNA